MWQEKQKDHTRNENKADVYGQIALHALILLYGISMVYLYYKQTQWTDGSVFESDLPAHIKMVIVDGWYYSLTAFVYKILYFLPFADMAIAVFLSLCSIASIYATAWLVFVVQQEKSDMLSKEKTNGIWQKKSTYLLIGILLNIVMPCYIKGLTDGRYIGMESASIWHNSTYIVMKWLGILSLLAYFRIENQIGKTLDRKKWLQFMLLLTITTGAKPSFLLVFAPMMLVYLIIDLIRNKIPFKRLFLFGCAVLPSLAVIYLQNAILFGKETGNSWTFSPGETLSQHSGYPFIAAVLSVFFPLTVLVVNLPALKKDRRFLAAWLMAVFGFAELFFFCETGSRVNDGNFMWGYSFAILVIFVASVVKWYENLRVMWKNHLIKMGYLCITGFLFLWHVYCGIYFYIHLVQGVSYWMWG